jgi:hypothetical protein
LPSFLVSGVVNVTILQAMLLLLLLLLLLVLPGVDQAELHGSARPS